MHELGIVFHIVKTVENVAVENQVSKVGKVVLQIGEVSTVIPSYLKDCWDWKCSKSEMMNGCELVIETIPAVTLCEDCKETYGTVEHGKICPYCGSENTYLLQGNEHEIKEIEVL
ncbi:MAG: hydrogenase maturation nickel metallochaperone HypA [Lachnospiraceae bacterium]|nr:hydrogenase maturation nickel metallochaperone HypA [Lachnospiraceae bacterium]